MKSKKEKREYKLMVCNKIAGMLICFGWFLIFILYNEISKIINISEFMLGALATYSIIIFALVLTFRGKK